MSRNLDLLQAAYQRAGRDGVDAVVDLLDPQVEWLAATPGPWDCHDREQVLETFRRQYEHGVRADFGEPIEAGDKVILDVRPYRRDELGNKTDRQRLWQVLTMREGKIVRIQDCTDQATALQAAGLPTGP
jgi:ketosteroid isomerase-like protein